MEKTKQPEKKEVLPIRIYLGQSDDCQYVSDFNNFFLSHGWHCDKKRLISSGDT